MPTRKARSSKRRAPRNPVTDERAEDRRDLARAVRIERDIQALVRRLGRELQRSNDHLQVLALKLGSRARALEAEHDVDRSLAGAEK